MQTHRLTPFLRFAQSSFRDPAGTVRVEADRVVRIVKPEFASETLAFLNSPLAQEWTRRGQLIATEVLQEPRSGYPLDLAHPRIFFPSYPWEWIPAQLAAAAELTLDLCEDLAEGGWILKDATPLNVLFDGTNPVFVDLLSVERRELDSPLWLAYGQFVRTFLLPLAAHRTLGWPLAAMMSRRDGYEPDELYAALGPLQRIRAPWRSLVTLPVILAGRTTGSSSRNLRLEPTAALAVLKHTLRSLRRCLRQLTPPAAISRWSSYPESASHYSADDARRKANFVRECLALTGPQHVLDIGCNTGFFSRLAAKAEARVVAWDADSAAAERAWRDAGEARADITAVVADFARPTPAVGWNNAETLSLLDRSRGRFDMVMMLAVLHHLLASDQIPLEDVARLARELTNGWLLIEWVNPDDPMFRKLSNGRDLLHCHLNEERFLSAFGPYFKPIRRDVLENRRVLHLLEVK